MRRAIRALIRKTFGKNHSMQAQASWITMVVCLAFIVGIVCFFYSILDMVVVGEEDPVYSDGIIIVNAPDSWKDFSKEKKLSKKYDITYKKTDAYFDVFTFSNWMKEEDAFMVLVFPEDFDEKCLVRKVEEKPEILTFCSSDHLEYVSMKDEFCDSVVDGDYYISLSQDLGVPLPMWKEPYMDTVPVGRRTVAGVAAERIARMVVPLLFFVSIMYVCMLIGMNAIAGDKERGTFASILMTPISRGTIVFGNYLGVVLHAMIPAAVLWLCLIFPASPVGLIEIILLTSSFVLLMAAITILISCMSNSIVSAQTAFLPIFLIVLVVCVTCMQSTSPNPVNRYIPVYGHFYGIGDSLMGAEGALPLLCCVMTSLLLAAICLLISRRLLMTEMFTVAVESKSEKEIRKAAARARKQANDYVSSARANVFGYKPVKRKPAHRFLIGHAVLPLALLSLFQPLAMIPAILSYMKSPESVEFLRMFRDMSGLRKISDALSESSRLFSGFMQNHYFILFMGIGYWVIIGLYILLVKKIERNPLKTLGFSSGKELSGAGHASPLKCYLRGLLFGLLLISSVYGLLLLTGQVSCEGFSLSSESILLFIFYIMMWIPQGATEEVMMRGYMLPRVASRFGIPFAVFFSSFCFSVLHAANAGFSILALLNLMLIAALFALIALCDGHIYTVCAMHTIWNFCQGNFFGLEVSGNPQSASILASNYTASSRDLLTGGGFGPEGGLCVTAVIAAAFLVLFFLTKRKKLQKV